jgi:putative membrane protein insertion efficiency factor
LLEIDLRDGLAILFGVFKKKATVFMAISILFLNQCRTTFIRSSPMIPFAKILLKAGRGLEKAEKILLVGMLGLYRSFGTTFLGGSCRFEPSCSAYALEALNRFPPRRACILIFKRILKCRPGGAFGYDPVPMEERRMT